MDGLSKNERTGSVNRLNKSRLRERQETVRQSHAWLRSCAQPRQTEKPNQSSKTESPLPSIGEEQEEQLDIITMATQTNDKTFSAVPLDWKEVYYTNQLPSRIRQQCRSGIGLDQRRVQENWRQVRVPPLPSREQLVSALYPQPRQPHPLRRFVPAHPCARGHPQDQAPEEEQGRSFRDVEL